MGERPWREGQIEELVGDQNQGPVAPPRCRNAREREKGVKKMSGEERLPEEQCTTVGMSGSLRGRRSEEMNQPNTSSPRGSEVPFESQRG